MTSATRIVFLHIPKTAGQSVHSELIKLVPSDAVSPIRVHTQAQDGAAQMPPDYLLYSGHLDWDTLGDVPDPRFVFMVLREPLERIASFYFYLLAKAQTLSEDALQQPHHTGMRMISTLSAEDYFFGGDKGWQRFIRDHYDNVQTTYLATRRMRGWAQINGMSQEDVLQQALASAEHIDGLYSTASLGRLEDDLERVTGIRPAIVGKRVNAGPETSTKRWPALAKLLGVSGRQKLEQYAETDARLLNRLAHRI